MLIKLAQAKKEMDIKDFFNHLTFGFGEVTPALKLW